MKFNTKIMNIILVLGSSLAVYPMMQDPIAGLEWRIKQIDLIGYKNIGTTDKQNRAVEQSWQESMEAIYALVNNKELSSLKSFFDKVQKFGNAVLSAAQRLKNFDLMKDKIKTVDTIKKEQSSMKLFLTGQKLKSTFSFGKKDEEYKKLKQLLMDIVDKLNNKIENMKKEIEIKKK